MAKTKLKMSTPSTVIMSNKPDDKIYPDSLDKAIEKSKQDAKILEEQGRIKDMDKLRSDIEENNANIYAEDMEINSMLTRASQFGEKLDSHEDFRSDAAEVVKAKEVDDYKAIAFLKWLETYLSPDELAFLPWPGMTRADAEAKNIRNTKSNVSPLLFDKPVNSGGRAKVETFYGKLVKSTQLGKDAEAALDTLDKEDAKAKLAPSEARPRGNFVADKQRATRVINQLLSAMRTAAHVR